MTHSVSLHSVALRKGNKAERKETEREEGWRNADCINFSRS